MKLYSAKAVAAELGLTTTEVNTLKRTGVIDYKQGTVYDLPETAKKIIRFYKGKQEADEALDYTTERAKLMRAKRKREEYDLELYAGTLHEASEVERKLTDMLLHFRARVLGIPANLAPKLQRETDSKRIFEILKTAMDDALEELSDYDSVFGTEEEPEEDE